ncbi:MULTISPECIES: ROK family protein [Aerococcus]|uniref:ROK family protein n=1 Tax=Aerococcus sanguinicola TaxID=119206 RepID=A0A5N1GRI1_9LACT|nr:MULTISPECIES: ROK family protein [Aerococcus]KAA9301300.1 ROK family protein [Aerococcus sanguinicola]MDK6370063.1 ROK family protein [Aerococcus sp. UMB9870]MDK6680671.1 ROK family protein [Aerococcus sp. UMB8608]MDK6687462.1 ROK family protein [Aerococcus sp. UMB8623]MDK6940621.1 ROK family protein [Aerococcus sp. UMB8487]
MAKETSYRIGVDVGGSKVSAALVTDQLEIVEKRSTATPQEDGEALFHVVKELITDLMAVAQPLGVRGIGLGIPGKVDREAGIARYQMMIPWPNFPIVDRLQAYFSCPIVIDNDVAVAALAEYQERSVREEAVFSYVTVSTGISSQNFVQGHLVRGQGFAGELALVPVDYRKPDQLVQHFASGTAIQERGQDLLANPQLTTQDIFDRAKSGQAEAQRLIEEGAQVLAWSLYQLICFFDPDEIVLGGSVIIEQPYYLQATKTALKAMLFSDQEHVLDHIRASHLGKDNGLLGAAALVD